MNSRGIKLNRIKFDMDVIKFIPIFENVTRTSPKDCILGDKSVLFIVNENEAARAIGKNGQHAKMLEKLLNRKVRIVEYSQDIEQFIRNLAYPLKIVDYSKSDDNIITIKGADMSTRSMLIGRNASSLRNMESIARRYFEIKEIKVS